MRPDAYLDGRADRRINPMAAFIFLPELIAGARFITLLDPPPLSHSTCPPCLRPLSPSVRRSVVDGDDVKNDTVFVAPFSIKPVAPSSGILLFQQRAHKGAKIIYVL